MTRRIGAALGVLVLALASGIPCFAQNSQAAAPSSLQDQLSAQYKPDTVLTVKKEGILSFPPNTPDRSSLLQTAGSIDEIPVKYQDGKIKVYNKFLSGRVSKDAGDLAVGEKVNPTKVEVNVKKDTVTISITECDACNGVQHSSFKAQVIFPFPKGYLGAADPGAVEDVIGQVLALDTNNETGGQQQAQAQHNQGQQQAQQAQDPQAAATSALTDHLSAQYKPDAVLTIKKAAILGFPPNAPVVIPTKFQDGQIHGPNKFLSGMVNIDARDLSVGEKVNPTKVDVNVKKETITISITECDACNGVQQSSRKAQVGFQFPKGYLETADPGQVEDYIGQVLELDSGNNVGGQQQGQAQDNQGQQQTQQAPDGAPQSSAAVQLGQTPDQVVAILGQPVHVVGAASGTTYLYKYINITFINNKVAATHAPAPTWLGQTPDQVIATLGQPVRIIGPRQFSGGSFTEYIYDGVLVLFVNDKVTRVTELQRQQQPPQAPPAPQPPPPPPQPPAKVELGQTPDQVIAILGQPDKIASVGPKQIYFYKDMKIIFINDKVSDVQ